MIKRTIYSFFILHLLVSIGFTQEISIKGLVYDNTQEPLYNITVTEKNTKNSTTTQIDGSFALVLEKKESILVFSYIGYTTKEIKVDATTTALEVILEDNLLSLKDVIIVGTRFNARSELTSPVPVDKINIKELNSTAQVSLDQKLNLKIPSFNATQQPISDAAAHVNPAELRGLGPSRTLVLINGKRKNPSALVYINDVPGKGEVGTDLQSINTSQIKRIEILRDGASAQYGSDAIAGVINIVLNDEDQNSHFNVYSGITSEGDGSKLGFDFNTGMSLLNNGFINFSAEYAYQEATNRANSPGTDLFFGEIYKGIPGLEDLGQSLIDGSNPWLKNNPDMGMKIGTPEMNRYAIGYNLSIPVSFGASLYSFGNTTYRKTKSFAVYRAPYIEPDPYNIFHKPGEAYNGFGPSFTTDIMDNHMAVGIKGLEDNWNYDLSIMYGQNKIDYLIEDTFNKELLKQSPTTFMAGGYAFQNMVANIDVSKTIGSIKLGLGTEFRTENFITNAGDSASYYIQGAVSFPGIRPENEINKDRYNFGIYTDIEFEKDIFLIGGALRYETYSDFGSTLNWKLNARIKLLKDNLVFRTSANTGFRAPSLHQIYHSSIQTLLSAGIISNQATFNNLSPAIRELQVPELKEEQSMNFSAGLTYNLSNKSGILLDFYQVKVNDRVLFSNEITSEDPNSPIYAILQNYDVTSLKFFTNAVNTKTNGFDLGFYYKDISLGKGTLSLNLAMNLTKHSIVGQIATPSAIEDSGIEMFNRKEQARILTARPSSKTNFSIDYHRNKLHLKLNVNRFGENTWQHAEDPNKDQTFSPKILTDVFGAYAFSEKILFSLSVNNIFNVYPDLLDAKGDNGTNLGGRFRYPWEINQFGYLGTTFQSKLSFTF